MQVVFEKEAALRFPSWSTQDRPSLAFGILRQQTKVRRRMEKTKGRRGVT